MELKFIKQVKIAMFAVVLAMALSSEAGATEGKNGGIEGTVSGFGRGMFVVYVEKIDGVTYPPMNPVPVLGQKRNTYVPHILPIVVGSKVEMRSDDPELHNVYAFATSQKKMLFNIGIPPNSPPQHQTFSKEGVVRLTCNVHKEMLAFILVLQNPYFVVIEKGTNEFLIKDVPAGKYQLRLWGEKLDDAILTRKFPVEVTTGGVAKVSLAQ